MIWTCDICGKPDTWCEPLNDGYKTKGIRDICETCSHIARKHLNKLQEESARLNKIEMIKFLESMKENINESKTS